METVVLLIVISLLAAGGTHSSAAAPAHPAKHADRALEERGAASHRENSFLAALMPLLDVTGRPLSKEEVAKSLNVVLTVLRDLKLDGVTYAGDNRVDGWHVEFFRVADRFNVSVSFRGFANDTGDVSVDRIDAELTARGWMHDGSITHPFLQETFVRDCRNVRVEHDGASTIRLELFNVC
jgi:hypothetical protein